MREKYYRIGKKTMQRYMGKIDMIPLLTLLVVNNCQPILHIPKRLVYIYTKHERINKSEIGYTIKSTLHVNNVFREQVEKFLRATFHQNTMEGIKNVTRQKDTCFISLIKFYESKTKNKIRVYRVLICVLYYVI